MQCVLGKLIMIARVFQCMELCLLSKPEATGNIFQTEYFKIELYFILFFVLDEHTRD